MIKWIITDMDGTLIGHQKTQGVTVDKNSIDIWNKKVASKKYKFSIATGRHYLNVIDLMNQYNIKLPSDGYIVGMNGAQIYSCKQKKLIQNEMIRNDELYQFDELKKYLDKHFLNKYILMGYQETAFPIFFYDHANKVFKEWMEEMCLYENSKDKFPSEVIKCFAKLDKVFKVIIIFKTDYDYQKEIKELSKILPNMSFAKSASEFVEIFPKNVDKLYSLKKISEIDYKIKSEDVLIFGDSFNDYKMLDWAGTAVTRLTAEPEIAAICDYVLDAPASVFVGDGLSLLLDK